MLITLSVPDNTMSILYTTQKDDNWETDPQKITMDMLVKVEHE